MCLSEKSATFRDHAQKLTTSFMAAAASAGTTLRATKSSQFLNFSLARASTIALERAGPIWDTLSSSAAVAVLRLTLAATGDVAAPVVVGFAGAAAEGAGCAGGVGGVPWARAGMDRSASIEEGTRTRRVNISVVPLFFPLARAQVFSARKPAGVCIHQFPDRRCACGMHRHPTDGMDIAGRFGTARGRRVHPLFTAANKATSQSCRNRRDIRATHEGQ